MTLVAILIVRRRALEQFRAFERHAAALMGVHGGRIERTVVTPVADAPDLLREIHVVTFPDPQAFQAYRDDARLGARAHLREAAIVSTEVFVGEEGPDYGEPASPRA